VDSLVEDLLVEGLCVILYYIVLETHYLSRVRFVAKEFPTSVIIAFSTPYKLDGFVSNTCLNRNT
jgi:hypothetical protein